MKASRTGGNAFLACMLSAFALLGSTCKPAGVAVPSTYLQEPFREACFLIDRQRDMPAELRERCGRVLPAMLERLSALDDPAYVQERSETLYLRHAQQVSNDSWLEADASQRLDQALASGPDTLEAASIGILLTVYKLGLSHYYATLGAQAAASCGAGDAPACALYARFAPDFSRRLREIGLSSHLRRMIAWMQGLERDGRLIGGRNRPALIRAWLESLKEETLYRLAFSPVFPARLEAPSLAGLSQGSEWEAALSRSISFMVGIFERYSNVGNDSAGERANSIAFLYLQDTRTGTSPSLPALRDRVAPVMGMRNAILALAEEAERAGRGLGASRRLEQARAVESLALGLARSMISAHACELKRTLGSDLVSGARTRRVLGLPESPRSEASDRFRRRLAGDPEFDRAGLVEALREELGSVDSSAVARFEEIHRMIVAHELSLAYLERRRQDLEARGLSETDVYSLPERELETVREWLLLGIPGERCG